MASIDLNCDMGESFGVWRMGDDEAMLDVVSSANLACGFHAGDPSVMRRTLLAAKARGVAVGAHPSFMDLYGFGRRQIQGERPEDLEAQLVYQIAALKGMGEAYGWPVTHVKPHGALSNMAAENRDLAEICVRAVMAVDPDLIFLTLPFSETMFAAERAGLNIACEVFADRAYDDNGMLAPRQREGAVIHDPAQSLAQVLSVVCDGVIPTLGGNKLPVKAASICVHSDTPGALAMARTLRVALEQSGLTIAPFANRASA